MRHRTAIRLTAAALALALVAPTAARGSETPVGSPSEGRMDVQVVLAARPDLPEAASPGAIAAILQEHAARTQGPLLARLARLHELGLVGGVQPSWISNSVSVSASPSAVAELTARPDVAAVTFDPVIVPAGTYDPASIESNLSQIGAPDAWAAGTTGSGVVIAVLDTGVDGTHPDLAVGFRGGSADWFDPYGRHAEPSDPSGHGTAVASIAVGRDSGGSAIGVAPDARWIAAKIFDDAGGATAAAIHAAFEWVLDPDGNPSTDDAPDVVLDSWTNAYAGCDTTFQPDLQALRAAGILPVFAAGNFGPSGDTSRSPANLPEAFSVGAVDDGLGVRYSSSRGPSSCTGDATFPDLVAPGETILSADLYGGYQSPSGTSFAAPHVAGALALLLGATPGLTPDQQAEALSSSAADLGDPGVDPIYGWGMLDIAALLGWSPTNIPPEASFTVEKGRKGSLTFDATTSSDPDGTIVAYQWDFGDGSTATGAVVGHAFADSAVHTVTLTVVDDLGATGTVSQDVGGSGGGKGGGGGGSGGGGGGGKGRKK